MGYLLLVILCIIALSCVVPFCQWLYYTFIKKDRIIWLFSDSLFNRHIERDYSINPSLMVRVINNREEMDALWSEEMKKTLP